MDSLTQAVLGAAVGQAVLGRKIGAKAAVWGAVCGTIPDLDVLVPLGDVVSDFTYHRSASHSLFVLAAVTPLVGWLIRWLHRDASPYRWAVPIMVYLVFATHVLLDSFTVYGTQIFWPFVTTPMTWSTIFIIDPLYTLPLLFGVTAALAWRRQAWSHRANLAGLALSTLYLGWSLGAKLHMDEVARESAATQALAATSVLTVPTPFNTVLWRFLAMTDDGDYYEAFHSVFEDRNAIRWQPHASDRHLLTAIQDSWPVQRLQWFTKGFYAVERIGDGVVLTDLRMGIEPDYVFRFKVGELSNPHTKPAEPLEQIMMQRSLSALNWLWARLRNVDAGSWVDWRKVQQGGQPGNLTGIPGAGGVRSRPGAELEQ